MKNRDEKRIFTFGTSTRSLDEFFSILEAYGIKGIADVRRFPRSGRYAHFNKEHLEVEVPKRGLLYRWLGDLLGGFRKGGYEAYQKEEPYSRGLGNLEVYAKENTAVIVCAEKLPWKCHRRFIAQSLKERGWDVTHVLEKDRVWQPKEQDEMVKGGRGELTY